ncbi:MAG: RelA/SpoT family protein [Terriglobales bacterium]
MSTAIPSPPDGVSANFAALAARIAALRPGADQALVARAYAFSLQHHQNQRRQSGEAFITHPLEVAGILAEMRMDEACIAAGLLHDAVEDTPATQEEIAAEFGPTVARLVAGVTKIDHLDLAGDGGGERRPGAAQAETVRKMLLAMVDDLRVILIKLADRLHNMRTLEPLPPQRQRAIAAETMEIYAPLAHRLGMGKIRGELEDLAFSYLEPEAYAQVQQAVEKRRPVNEAFLAQVRARVESALAEHDIPCRVEGRIKRFYSIWQKLRRQAIEIEQVYDLLAVRVITDSVRDCYAALGIIHNTWHPVPGRIKDFIAMPRPNGYQSLHTSVMHESGQPFEAQIRTAEMHRMAEDGIAAHWKYKDGALAAEAEDERIGWLRRVVEWQQEMRDPGEFLATLKVDLHPEEVYAFTPKGRIIRLPREATPVDFAFAIHTEVGHRCVGAKLNGRMAPLRTPIQNGDIVEILTQAGHAPSRDWLGFVKTTRARQKIRHWIGIHERAQAVEIGRRALEREARKRDGGPRLLKDADLASAGREYGYLQAEDVQAAIGYGKISARQIVARLAGERPGTGKPGRLTRPPAGEGAGPILVRGFHDLMVYRARCCHPLPGEAIVGYITRGRGVAVHAESCANVQSLMYQADRRIDVAWAPQADAPQPVRLRLHTDDRAGMLSAITGMISANGANIVHIAARTGQGRARIEVILEARNLGQLEAIQSGLKGISGVHGVERR